MIVPRHLTIEETDELIGNLDDVMDRSSMTNHDKFMEIRNDSALSEEKGDNLQLTLLSQIWDGFVEYCNQNELDPAQQVREAIASHYQDLLKTYRIRTRLTLSDIPQLT